MDPSPMPPPVDWPQILALDDVQTLIELAIREDLGEGDVTTNAIFETPTPVVGRIVARQPTVACGIPLAEELFQRFDPDIVVEHLAVDGADLYAGDDLLRVRGDARAVLPAERPVLNFLMRLCGIAMAARLAAQAVPDDCRARVYDTRKTLPGWRRLDKAAVLVGGAQNHRFGLFDAVLIKDNHIHATGSVAEAVRRARAVAEGMPIEVEVDRLDQLEEAIEAGAHIVLIDNFDEATMREAVTQAAGRVELEASGGLTRDRITAVAQTGVDRISLGALTHSVMPADLGLDFDEA